MIADEMSIRDVRAQFADVLDEVSINRRTIWVTRRGRRIAKIAPIDIADGPQTTRDGSDPSRDT